jgi:hypothetical protein
MRKRFLIFSNRILLKQKQNNKQTQNKDEKEIFVES